MTKESRSTRICTRWRIINHARNRYAWFLSEAVDSINGAAMYLRIFMSSSPME
jgi:hypothetical protein